MRRKIVLLVLTCLITLAAIFTGVSSVTTIKKVANVGKAQMNENTVIEKVVENNIVENNVLNDISSNIVNNVVQNKENNVVNDSLDEIMNYNNVVSNNTIVNNITNNVVLDNTVKEDNVKEEIQKEESYISEDDLLYSSVYLVKDKTVYRVEPETSLEAFKKNVEIAEGNEIKFYKGEEEVTEGYVGTGMQIIGTNGQQYEISVKGDITGDGIANQVELTMMIRHLIGLDNWKLNGVRKAAGDINGDGELNLVDINKIINYIVYGTWNYDERSMPNAPEIEVISSKVLEEDYYEGEVIFKVIEDKTTKNSKTTYKITGSKTQEETEISEEEEITIKGEGSYLITAYTYGVEGNRSKGANRLITIKDEDSIEKYTVTYMPGEYGTFGPQIIANIKHGQNTPEFSGEISGNTKYRFIGWSPELSEKVTGNVVYTAMWEEITEAEYRVEHYKENLDGTYKLEQTEEFVEEVGNIVTASAKIYEGFTLNENVSGTVKTAEVAVDGSTTLKLYYNRNEYTVRFVNEDGTELQNTSVAYGSMPVYAGATPEKARTAEYTYTFAGWDKEISVVTGDVTYTATYTNTKNSYTLTLIAGENVSEVIGAGTYENGQNISISAILKEETGYTITFNEWESNKPEIIANQETKDLIIVMPTEDITLTATANKTVNQYNYTVEYYYDNEKDNTKTETKQANYGSTIETVTDKNKTGYEEDLSKETGLPLTISENESTNIVRKYYKETIYNISYELNGGEVEGTNPVTYTVNSDNITLINPTKEGYTFIGWTGSNGNAPEISVTIAKGSIGDKEYTANYRANTDTEYKVEHYTENLDGTYKLQETENLTGTTNEVATAIAKTTYNGFTYNEAIEGTISSGIIAPNGSLVLKLYYTRNEFTVKFVDYDGEEIKTEIVKYEGNATAPTNPTRESNVQYTYTFAGWDKEYTNVTEDKIVTARYTETINQYNYTVEYYYDNEKDNTKTETKQANYGSTIETVTDKNKTGYEEDLSKETGLPLTISENESTNIVRKYYKETIYNISYELNGGEVEGTNPVTYTVNSDNITLINPTKEGYTFIGWTGSNGNAPEISVTIAKGSIGDKEYTANYRANTDTEYKVEHYTENLDGTYKLQETENLTGTTNEVATAIAKTTYNGFTYNEAIEGTISSGIIAPNGSLVLKLFYTRNSYILTLAKEENIASIENGESEEVAVSYKHGETVSIKATLEEIEGYTVAFAGWKTNNSSLIGDQALRETEIIMPIGDITLTATANKTINQYNYTIEYYYNNEIDDSKTSTIRANYGTEIREIEDKNITGYVKEKVETLPFTIGTVEENNVIRVYYKEEIYNIEYNLNGGEVEGTNPVTYTVNSDNITLINPTKEGYTFTGWTGSNGDTAETNVTIEKGSTGDKAYVANWVQNVYKIIVHHKEEGTNEQVAVDEEFGGDYGDTYNITDLITNAGENGREEINTNKYVYSRVEGSTNGTFTGSVLEREVTFYYDLTTFSIIGEAGENGSISDITETVKYGNNSTKEIKITPNEGYEVESVKVNDEEVEYELDIETDVAILPLFENVTENKKVTVTFKQMVIKVEITTSADAVELEGTQYSSIKKALKAMENAGLTSSSSQTTITLLTNTEETNTINNQNVEIDLAGNSVTSNSTSATLTVASGSLNVLDSTNSTGTIKNTAGVGVKIESTGTLTIGVDDRRVSRIAPIIEGTNYGVENLGTFDFYDGKIIGNQAIKGTITEKAYLKEASIDDTTLANKEIATLVTISNAEAAIVNSTTSKIYKTYTTLELAIEEANNVILTTENQVEIVLLKDITRTATQTLEIDNTKNIKLNLNGQDMTIPGGIINEGKIELADEQELLDEETENGMIMLESTGTIQNTGDFVLTGAVITSSIANTSVINNTNNVIIAGGSITATGANINVIDSSEAEILMTGGSITATGANTYAIKNTKGNIEITGGTITSVAQSSCYGINNIEGTVTLTGGEITAGNNIIYNNKGEVYAENATLKANRDLGIYNKEGNIKLVDGSLNVSASYVVVNNGIYSDGGTIEVSGTNIYVRETWTTRNGIQTINNANVTIDGNADVCSVIINETGKLKIEDSTLLSVNVDTEEVVTIDNTSISSVLQASDISTVKVTGGTIRSITNNGNVDVKNTTLGDGEVNNKGEGIIKFDNITSNSTVIKNYDTGIMDILDSTINVHGYHWGAFDGVANYGSTDVNIENCVFNAGGSSNAVVNYGSGKININKADINGGLSTAIFNKNTGEIDAIEIKIDGSSTAISNTGTGIIKIGDIITEESAINIKAGTAIYNTGGGTVVIGSKDNNIENEFLSIIATSSCGIYNLSGEIYYYDGTITAPVDKTICGNIKEIEDNSSINIDTNANSTQTAYLSNVENVAIITESVDNSLVNTRYSTLNEALSAAVNKGDKIQLLSNVQLVDSVALNNDAEITIDLAGFTIDAYAKIENNGILEILDNSDNKTGKIVRNSYDFIINNQNAKLTLENISIISNQSGISSAYSKFINNLGELNLNNTNISITNGSCYEIYNDGEGIININGGTYKKNANYEVIYNNGTGTINIYSGTISGKGINNVNSEGTINITGGSVSSGITNSGKLNISGGNINSITNAGGDAVLEIAGGEISGITNSSTGEVIMTGGKVTTDGIRNNGAGTITIGLKDGVINTEIPEIIGNTIGIYNNT